MLRLAAFRLRDLAGGWLKQVTHCLLSFIREYKCRVRPDVTSSFLYCLAYMNGVGVTDTYQEEMELFENNLSKSNMYGNYSNLVELLVITINSLPIQHGTQPRYGKKDLNTEYEFKEPLKADEQMDLSNFHKVVDTSVNCNTLDLIISALHRVWHLLLLSFSRSRENISTGYNTTRDTLQPVLALYQHCVRILPDFIVRLRSPQFNRSCNTTQKVENIKIIHKTERLLLVLMKDYLSATHLQNISEKVLNEDYFPVYNTLLNSGDKKLVNLLYQEYSRKIYPRLDAKLVWKNSILDALIKCSNRNPHMRSYLTWLETKKQKYVLHEYPVRCTPGSSSSGNHEKDLALSEAQDLAKEVACVLFPRCSSDCEEEDGEDNICRKEETIGTEQNKGDSNLKRALPPEKTSSVPSEHTAAKHPRLCHSNEKQESVLTNKAILRNRRNAHKATPPPKTITKALSDQYISLQEEELLAGNKFPSQKREISVEEEISNAKKMDEILRQSAVVDLDNPERIEKRLRRSQLLYVNYRGDKIRLGEIGAACRTASIHEKDVLAPSKLPVDSCIIEDKTAVQDDVAARDQVEGLPCEETVRTGETVICTEANGSNLEPKTTDNDSSQNYVFIHPRPPKTVVKPLTTHQMEKKREQIGEYKPKLFNTLDENSNISQQSDSSQNHQDLQSCVKIPENLDTASEDSLTTGISDAKKTVAERLKQSIKQWTVLCKNDPSNPRSKAMLDRLVKRYEALDQTLETDKSKTTDSEELHLSHRVQSDNKPLKSLLKNNQENKPKNVTFSPIVSTIVNDGEPGVVQSETWGEYTKSRRRKGSLCHKKNPLSTLKLNRNSPLLKIRDSPMVVNETDGILVIEENAICDQENKNTQSAKEDASERDYDDTASAACQVENQSQKQDSPTPPEHTAFFCGIETLCPRLVSDDRELPVDWMDELGLPLKDYCVTEKVLNALGVSTVGQLAKLSDTEISCEQSVSRRCLIALRDYLSNLDRVAT